MSAAAPKPDEKIPLPRCHWLSEDMDMCDREAVGIFKYFGDTAINEGITCVAVWLCRNHSVGKSRLEIPA
jgi:hypothetical protein